MEYPPGHNDDELTAQQEATVSDLRSRIEAAQQIGPAAAAFYEACASNPLYPKVAETVRSRMRPRIALEFVRNVTTRTGVNRGRADIRPTFDEAEIKRNIEQLQANYGVTPPTDAHARLIRRQRIDRQMERAGVVSSKLDPRMPYVPEIDVAYRLYHEIVETGDADARDSLEVLLAAYGMSIENRIRPLE